MTAAKTSWDLDGLVDRGIDGVLPRSPAAKELRRRILQ